MTPRLNKRQHREQDELAMLVDEQKSFEDESNDEQAVSQTPGGFAALMITANDEEEEEEEDENVKEMKKKSKKKRKKSTPATSGSISAPVILVSEQSKEQKKAAKKARQKEQKEKETTAKKNEVEKALEELSIRYPDIKAPSSVQSLDESSHISRSSLASLLSLTPQSLSPEAELRKFFGSKVIGGPSTTTSSRHRPTSYRGIPLAQPETSSLPIGASKGKARSKVVLTIPKQNWAHGRFREGLNARILHPEQGEVPWYATVPLSSSDFPEGQRKQDNANEEETWYTLVASTKYKGFTKAFVDTVHRGDPSPFYTLLQHHPYHADTLLQMAEIAAHREEHSQISTLLERALYAYERAFQFGSVPLTLGCARLDFRAAECRGFFLNVGRYIIDLLRRGCPSTAYSFSQLLLSLDPYTDPHGALLWLDYTTPKCFLSLSSSSTSSSHSSASGAPAVSEWFENMYALGSARGKSSLQGREEDEDIWRWDCLPGWMYTRAMIARGMEGDTNGADHSKSTLYLLEAFQTYPELIPLIADKADISLSKELSADKRTRVLTGYSDAQDHGTATLHLLAHLYATRTGSTLWKLPPFNTFFSSNIPSTLPTASKESSSKRSTLLRLVASPTSHLTRAIHRHVLVASQSAPPSSGSSAGTAANYKRLFRYFPKDVANEAERSVSFDPLPPIEVKQGSVVGTTTRYDNRYFEGVESAFGSFGNGLGGGEDGVARLAVEQIQAFLDANPDMARRFPGGAQQMARMMVDEPGALFEGMLAEAAMGVDDGDDAGNEGNMPGGFEDGDELDRDVEDADSDVEPGGHDDVEGDATDNEVDDQNQAQPTLLQNIFGRFWNFGGGGG